jgi:hypothetical protein
MGSRGLSDVQGLMLGSVTHKVMQIADVPVLGGEAADKEGAGHQRRSGVLQGLEHRGHRNRRC